VSAKKKKAQRYVSAINQLLNDKNTGGSFGDERRSRLKEIRRHRNERTAK
jgi:hypothetical protein